MSLILGEVVPDVFQEDDFISTVRDQSDNEGEMELGSICVQSLCSLLRPTDAVLLKC